jgi:hypothetical protein
LDHSYQMNGPRRDTAPLNIAWNLHPKWVEKNDINFLQTNSSNSVSKSDVSLEHIRNIFFY